MNVPPNANAALLPKHYILSFYLVPSRLYMHTVGLD